MNNRVLAVGIAVVALLAFAIPASASGAVTIGSALTLQDDANEYLNCGGNPPCTVRQNDLAASSTASGGLVAPMDGVVVRWRIKVGSSTGPVALRVIRFSAFPRGNTGVGTGPTVTPPLNQTTTYDVRLPISGGNGVTPGDQVGIDCCFTNFYVFHDFSFGSGWNINVWGPALVDNAPPRTANDTFHDVELLINADIEADADLDGYGDETQDLCPTNAAIQGPCTQPQPQPPAAVAGPTGQRDAALKKCKTKAKKRHWSKKQLKKCKKQANLLPV